MKRRANRTCPANHVLGRGLALAGVIPVPPSPIEQVHNFFAQDDISNLFNQLERCCAYQQRFHFWPSFPTPHFAFANAHNTQDQSWQTWVLLKNQSCFTWWMKESQVRFNTRVCLRLLPQLGKLEYSDRVLFLLHPNHCTRKVVAHYHLFMLTSGSLCQFLCKIFQLRCLFFFPSHIPRRTDWSYPRIDDVINLFQGSTFPTTRGGRKRCMVLLARSWRRCQCQPQCG